MQTRNPNRERENKEPIILTINNMFGGSLEFLAELRILSRNTDWTCILRSCQYNPVIGK